MSYKVRSPILFLIFNRPFYTRKVFDEIRRAAPERLYIAADGPRIKFENDVHLCEQTRDILNRIDWECKVLTRLNNENEGCKVSVSNSITWFFNHENEGIILEDDCLPAKTFFQFCDEMLNHYRSNPKIRHISGSN